MMCDAGVILYIDGISDCFLLYQVLKPVVYGQKTLTDGGMGNLQPALLKTSTSILLALGAGRAISPTDWLTAYNIEFLERIFYSKLTVLWKKVTVEKMGIHLVYFKYFGGRGSCTNYITSPFSYGSLFILDYIRFIQKNSLEGEQASMEILP